MTIEERYKYHTRQLLRRHYNNFGWMCISIRGRVHYVSLHAFGSVSDANIVFKDIPHWKDDNCLKARFNEKSEILGRIIGGQYVKEVE